MDIERIDVALVNEKFTACLREQDDIALSEYLSAYIELCKFFNGLGTIFSFVSSDLTEKFDILAQHIAANEATGHFATVTTMIAHEKAEKLLKKSKYVSGCRTLLRIHRGMDFIQEFLTGISMLSDEDSTSAMCHDAYERTLAEHHGLLVKVAARLAMWTLPNRKELLINALGNDPEAIKRAVDLLPVMLNTLRQVHGRIDALYTAHNLHGLP